MDKLVILLTVLTGLFFGIWPLFMNKSGLGGNLFGVVFIAVMFVVALPFGLKEYLTTPPANAKWMLVVLAGVIGALGFLCYNGALAKTPKESVSTVIVMMIVVQTLVPAVYQIYVSESVSLMKMGGIVLAAVSAYLLCKG